MQRSKLITAKEARRLAGATLEEKMESICCTIRERAQANHRCLKTGWHHKDDHDLWNSGGYNKTNEWNQAKEYLEDLGFKVTFYNEYTTFIDRYTLIEW